MSQPGIRSKMFAAISLVVIISITASGLFAYYYFTDILTKQAIKDDRIKLHQTSLQFANIQEDIRKFSNNIIIDSEIQNNIKININSNDPVKNVSRGYAIVKRLEAFCVLRDSIQSAAIVTSDGSVYYSDYPYDSQGFKDALAEDWYKEYKSSNESVYFSKIHRLASTDRISGNEVVSYIVPLRNIDEPTQVYGELILNVYLNYFDAVLHLASSDFDNYIWLDGKNNTLYEKSASLNSFGTPLFSDFDELSGSLDQSAVEKKADGYIVMDASMNNGWKLAAFASEKRLFGAIGYIFYFFLAFVIASLLFAGIVILPVIRGITEPISKLTKAMKLVSGGDLSINLDIKSKDEIEILSNGFNKMISDLKKHIEDSVKQESAKKQMEFDLLLAQINPHFIYNTLNTVVYLARRDKNDDVVSIVNSFIGILQDAVQIGDGGIFAAVRQEIQIVNHYMTIRNFQHQDRFDLEWDIDQTLLDCLIPKTLIQPLVENALLHGLYPKKGKGRITVSIKHDAVNLIILVEDNGIGVNQELADKLVSETETANKNSRLRSIGIPNIRDRIRHLYGPEYGICICGKPNIGTQVTVTLPFVDNSPEIDFLDK